MKVVCYEPHYNDKLAGVVRAFAEGCGAEVRDQRKYIDCDIAVMFGWYKYAYIPTMSKRDLLNEHVFERGRRIIVIESSFVRRGEYYQIGFDGFAGYADFNTRGRDLPLDRWQAIYGDHVAPWRSFNPEGNVVVMGQLPRDTQVQDVDHIAWVHEMMDLYRDFGLPVKFRPHPRENPYRYGVRYNDFTRGKLDKVFEHARCVVTWNSTSAVDAVLAGVPVITCNRGSIAWPVAGHDPKRVGPDDLQRPDRTAWLAGLGYSQWTTDEMRRGLPWKHLMTAVPSLSPSSPPDPASETNTSMAI